jgi:pimeloyl-ACP methyl ester carboxylesterase
VAPPPNVMGHEVPLASMGRHMQRVLHVIGRALLGSLALILVLAAGCAINAAVASKQDLVRYPPPGRMVDVDGYQLHVLCMGEGSPTVLLDSVSGGWTLEWAQVQPLVARTTRVCGWDRAGSGWSDLGPHDHSPLAYTAEMEAMLRGANIEGPYVLVAASYAGRLDRLYASRHPERVLGMVLVDAVHEDSFSAQAIADEKWQQPMMDAGLWILSRLGVARVLGPRLLPLLAGPVAYTMPEAAREEFAVIMTQPKNVEGNARLGAHHRANDAQLRASGSLGDQPLVVLSSTDMLAHSAEWGEGQAKLANLSARSVHLIADGSHLIAWEHPDLVVNAIECVLTAAAHPATGALADQALQTCLSTRG